MLDIIIWALAILAVLVSLLNPGGLIIGLLIAALLLGGRYGLPFIGDIVRARQRGLGSAKVEQRARKQLRGENGQRNDTDGGDDP